MYAQKSCILLTPDVYWLYMFLLKYQPKTASRYLEWWVKQLRNFPVKNRQSKSHNLHNVYLKKNEKLSIIIFVALIALMMKKEIRNHQVVFVMKDHPRLISSYDFLLDDLNEDCLNL